MPANNTAGRSVAARPGTSGNDRPSNRSRASGSGKPRSRSRKPVISWASHTTATAGQCTCNPASAPTRSARTAAEVRSATASVSVPATGSSQTMPFAAQYGRRRSPISSHRYLKRDASRVASSVGMFGISPVPGFGSQSSRPIAPASVIPSATVGGPGSPERTRMGCSGLSSRSTAPGSAATGALHTGFLRMANASARRASTEAPSHATNTASRVAYTCTGAPGVRGSARTANGNFVAAKKSAVPVAGLPITTKSGTSLGSMPAASSAFNPADHDLSISG